MTIVEPLRFRRYGITTSIYNTRLEEQGNRCAICRKVLDNPHIDHDHKTKEFRGILCSNCNTGLGMFLDDIRILSNAIVYLEDHGKGFKVAFESEEIGHIIDQ